MKFLLLPLFFLLPLTAYAKKKPVKDVGSVFQFSALPAVRENASQPEPGLAFLSVNYRTLYTAAQHLTAVLGNPLRDGVARIALIDKKKQKVFEGEVKVQTLGAFDSRHEMLENNFVRLTLPEDLPGTPLPFAKQEAKPGDIVKVFSNEGTVQRVGTILAHTELEKMNAPVPPGDFLVMDYPPLPGMLGGPLLDARGGVLGIVVKAVPLENGKGHHWAITTKRLHALTALKGS